MIRVSAVMHAYRKLTMCGILYFPVHLDPTVSTFLPESVAITAFSGFSVQCKHILPFLIPHPLSLAKKMARDEIIEKLKAEMSLLPIRRESQVVYIMAEIRKALEQSNSGESAPYATLKFFCNWALHSKIDQQSSQKRIQEFCAVFDLQNIHSRKLSPSNFMQQMILLGPLKEALIRFFSAHSIESKITCDVAEWWRFVYHYSGVVSDVPLIRTEPVPETEIRTVTVSRLKDPMGQTPDYLHWETRDGRRITSTRLGPPRAGKR